MEFDIVELERKTMAEREAEENCWIAWMRHLSKIFDSSATILDGTKWKFADRAERRKSLRRISLSENELFDVLHLSKYGIVANNYDRKSSRLGRRCPCTNELEVDMARERIIDSSASSNWIVDRGRGGANS